MSKATRKWLRGLIAAGVNSGASAVTVTIVDPHDFNVGDGIGKLGSVVMVSAIVGIALYLKDHALPDEDVTVT